jgi:hypothetical protein
MSTTVLLIAAAHGIPVIIGRILWGKPGASTVAFFTSIVALIFGDLSYAIFDLIAIGIVLYICMNTGSDA